MELTRFEELSFPGRLVWNGQQVREITSICESRVSNADRALIVGRRPVQGYS